MRVLYAVVFIAVLIVIPYAGFSGSGLRFFFAVILPYAALATFLVGVLMGVVRWARAPVPFRIPTTCGQQFTLPWIPSQRLENPHTTLGVIGRMALEVLFFRSLFRNTKSEIAPGPRLNHSSEKFLWLAALLFHWSFLVILIRHLRLFTEPVPFFVHWAQDLDGFFQLGLPPVYLTNLLIAAGLGYLFARRLASPTVRYVSLVADYFPLLLLLAIGTTGFLMRHVWRVDVMGVKELALGLVTLKPHVPASLSPLFATHLFLVCALFAYFPFSKLMHMAGVFMSPTRNLVNNSRMKRHVNPWNPQVKVHTYAEWQEEFTAEIEQAGLPFDPDFPKGKGAESPAGGPAKG